MNLRIYMSREYPFPSEENFDQLFDVSSDQLVHTIKVPASKGNFFKPSDKDMFFGFYSLTDLDNLSFVFSFGNKCENNLKYKLLEQPKEQIDYTLMVHVSQSSPKNFRGSSTFADYRKEAIQKVNELVNSSDTKVSSIHNLIQSEETELGDPQVKLT